MNRAARTTTVLTAGLALSGALLGVSASPAHAATTASGRVMCVDQRPVEGVWIVAQNGGSNWASWRPTAGASYEASYSMTLPNGGGYKVNVGCGGSPQSWATNNKSVSYTTGNRYFTCYDTYSAYYAYQSCQIT